MHLSQPPVVLHRWTCISTSASTECIPTSCRAEKERIKYLVGTGSAQIPSGKRQVEDYWLVWDCHAPPKTDTSITARVCLAYNKKSTHSSDHQLSHVQLLLPVPSPTHASCPNPPRLPTRTTSHTRVRTRFNRPPRKLLTIISKVTTGLSTLHFIPAKPQHSSTTTAPTSLSTHSAGVPIPTAAATPITTATCTHGSYGARGANGWWWGWPKFCGVGYE